MTYPIRLLHQPDLPVAIEVIARAFGGGHHDEDDAVELALWEPERFYGAFDSEQLVGTCGSFSLDMTVPGGPRPVAGVTWVSVAPTHHRQGVARSLMRRQLDDLHEAGEPVAALWASEGAIYQRYGYGPASWALLAEVPSGAAFNRAVATGGLEVLTAVEATELVPAFDYVRTRQAGWYARSDAWWRYRLYDPEHRRSGASPLLAVVHRSRYGIDGYALYNTRSAWDHGPAGKVNVRELAAASPEVSAQLWRYLLDLDLMRTVKCTLAPNDALLHLLADPRAARGNLVDALWVRLVDVPTALASRSYAAEVDVVLDVVDEFCPWNAGRLRLSAELTGASCAPTTDAAELRVNAGDLGAVYLGGPSLAQRAAAGHVVELREGALAAASTAFGWPGPAPYCPMVF